MIAEWTKNLYKTATHSHKETKHKTYAHCLLWYMLYWFCFIFYMLTFKTNEKERERERSLGQFYLHAVSSSVSLLPISIFNGTQKTEKQATTLGNKRACIVVCTHNECMAFSSHSRTFWFSLSGNTIDQLRTYVCVCIISYLSFSRCVCISFFPFN